MLFGKKRVSADTMVNITEQGRREAEEQESQSAPYRILGKLYERSPKSAREISAEAGVPIDEAKGWLEKLEKRGDVRIGGGGGLE